MNENVNQAASDAIELRILCDNYLGEEDWSYAYQLATFFTSVTTGDPFVDSVYKALGELAETLCKCPEKRHQVSDDANSLVEMMEKRDEFREHPVH